LGRFNTLGKEFYALKTTRSTQQGVHPSLVCQLTVCTTHRTSAETGTIQKKKKKKKTTTTQRASCPCGLWEEAEKPRWAWERDFQREKIFKVFTFLYLQASELWCF
jgi:hypothetical protein